MSNVNIYFGILTYICNSNFVLFWNIYFGNISLLFYTLWMFINIFCYFNYFNINLPFYFSIKCILDLLHLKYIFSHHFTIIFAIILSKFSNVNIYFFSLTYIFRFYMVTKWMSGNSEFVVITYNLHYIQKIFVIYNSLTFIYI